MIAVVIIVIIGAPADGLVTAFKAAPAGGALAHGLVLKAAVVGVLMISVLIILPYPRSPLVTTTGVKPASGDPLLPIFVGAMQSMELEPINVAGTFWDPNMQAKPPVPAKFCPLTVTGDDPSFDPDAGRISNNLGGNVGLYMLSMLSVL